MTSRFFGRLLAAGALVGALFGSAAAHATASYTSLTVFGDSLSDTGNVFLATGGAVPVPPYYQGRFSDGPVWIDVLAAGMGTPLGAVPSLAGGTNYAFGGARSGVGGNPPGVLAQIGGMWAPATAAADPTGLYVLVVGGNNMRDARTAYPGDSAADAAGRQAVANQTAVDIITGLGLLASKGVQNVLIANLPDLGDTPEAAFLGVQAASSDASARFNALLPVIMGVGTQTFGMNMSFLDMAGLAAAVIVDATTNGGAQFGITNVTTPCGPFQGSIGIACEVSLFSDALHPSARAHELLGEAALIAVGIPEPATALMLLAGIGGLLAVRRRRNA